MADQAQLLPGTLDLLILKAVSLGPLTVTACFCASGRSRATHCSIEQGALYPGLFRLVRQGLLKASWGTSENNRRAKFYELTAAGRKRLREETESWNRLASAIGFCALRATGGSMKLLDSLRFRIAALFQPLPRSTPRWRRNFARTSSTAPMIWSVPGLIAPRPSAARASSSAARSDSSEECHEAIGGSFIETLIQDVRFSLRVLRKSPGFTVVAVLTLALAIGANAVVFGVLNALILRPLNVPQAQSLYAIERGNDESVNQSYPDYLDLRDRNRSFEASGGLQHHVSAGLDTGNDPSRVLGL